MGKNPNEIDYSKLLGFGYVSDQLAKGVDFRDETVAAKIGAKVGIEMAPVTAKSSGE